MEKLKAWWESLATREQQIVAVGGVMLLIAVFYWGIWTPIANAEADAVNRLKAQQQTLAYVKETANKLAGLRQNGSRPTMQGSITNVVNQTAGRYGLTITRMQPQGNKIQLWMDDVPFDALLGYLGDMVQQKGLSLELLDVGETDTPGMVKVRRIQLAQ